MSSTRSTGALGVVPPAGAAAPFRKQVHAHCPRSAQPTLVDAPVRQTSLQQNAALVEWVRSFGRTLAHVYITHGHGDHLFGVKQVTDAFPGLRAVATSSTVEESTGQALPQMFETLGSRCSPA